MSVRVTITNELGMHARAAARFVQEASRFDSEVWVSKGGERINGKSIMGILTLAAARGQEVLIEAEGHDENEVLGVLERLVSSGFGDVGLIKR